MTLMTITILPVSGGLILPFTGAGGIMIPSLRIFTGTPTIHGTGASAFTPDIHTGASVLAGDTIPTGIPLVTGHTTGPGTIPGTEITGMAIATVITMGFMMGTTDIIHRTIITEHLIPTGTTWPMEEFTTGTATGVVPVDREAVSAVDIQPPLTDQSQAGVTMFQQPAAGRFLTATL